EVLRVLGAGAGVGLALAYMVQAEPRGLPHVVRCARPWLGDADVVFAMPDTIVLPADALRRTHEFRLSSGADLTLGCFPVEEPERFGPVEVAPDGSILRILDKPPHREVKTVWGVCAWAASFTRFCADWDEAAERERPGERVLSNAFDSARTAGLKVNACVFPDGGYLDIGTPRGLRAALRSLVERGVLDQVQAALSATDG
ncbi:MAG TPA: sugar phosphate nucleotidyltransferase, partial [Vicinamibacteria bacterium]|nr:sugar phosphate nucleotidyltransferase [Vicinamibacteria bacterium]